MALLGGGDASTEADIENKTLLRGLLADRVAQRSQTV